jgi:hypothetical protein
MADSVAEVVNIDPENPAIYAPRAEVYEIAFKEGGRALDGQERTVNELRSRASVLVAAAAVTTSFFGGRVLTGQDPPVFAWVAIAAFVAVGVTVLAVLWPRHDWEFSADAVDVIEDYAEPSLVPTPLVHRDLAIHRSNSYAKNAKQLGTLYFAFRGGLVCLVIEVVAWVVALADGTNLQ